MTGRSALRVGIVALESSADQLGVFVIQALRNLDPECQIEGIMGPQMRALGFKSLFNGEDIAVMGFSEVLKKLPRILKIRASITQYFIQNPPDLFIGIDAPDFNLTLEHHLRKKNIKTLHYVSPSIWAWKAWRIHKIIQSTLGVLCLFPFEAPLYEKHHHPAWFVGHPLADLIPLQKPREEACRVLGLDSKKWVLALLPGSRLQELERLLPIYIRTVVLIRQTNPAFSDLQVVLPVAHRKLESVIQKLKPELIQANIQIIEGQAHQVLASADLALATSGTVTLEAMLYKTPMVVAYKLSNLSYQIAKRMVKLRYFSLPNIISNQNLVPEFLQAQVTPEALSSTLLDFLEHPQKREALQKQFTEIHESMQANTVQRLTEIFGKYVSVRGSIFASLNSSSSPRQGEGDLSTQTLVLGAGVTGASVVRFLSSPEILIPHIVVNDKKESPSKSSPESQEIIFSQDFLDASGNFKISQVIASPGFKPSHPVLTWAKNHEIPIVSDIQVFLDHAKAPVILITGTNGKSTVTTLVGELLKAHGLSVGVGGNLGVPALDLLDSHRDVYVLELSSFQLFFTPRIRSVAAAILNLEPDHLDWHQDLAEYYGAKWRISQNTESFVLPTDLNPDPDLNPEIDLSCQKQILRFNSLETEGWVLSKTLQTHHHRANVAAAVKLVSAFKIPQETLDQVLKTFPGLPYRCQWIGNFEGVDWYNDSKGTNVGATQAAIRSLKDPKRAHLVLLLGGVGKGQDFSPLARETIGCVRVCIVYGRDQNLIAESFKNLETPPQLICMENLEQAVQKARDLSFSGDCVLFSPACASFDQFKNYEERGERFNQWVHQALAE